MNLTTYYGQCDYPHTSSVSEHKGRDCAQAWHAKDVFPGLFLKDLPGHFRRWPSGIVTYTDHTKHYLLIDTDDMVIAVHDTHWQAVCELTAQQAFLERDQLRLQVSKLEAENAALKLLLGIKGE